MKFALRPLALYVYQSISPAQLLQPEETIEKTKQITLHLAENMQIDFMEQYFRATKTKAQTACIHATQSCAVNLADKLQYYIAQVNQMPLPKTAQEECIAFYHIIQEQLLHLLNFLQTSFHQHFNTEQKLPDYHGIQIQQYFLQSATRLEKQITKGISPQIIQLITEPIKNYYRPGGAGSLTYGMYAYWKTLLEQLQQATPAENNTYLQTLIRHNFNHAAFINHLLEIAYTEINQLETDAEKKEQWAKQLRAINRLHTIPGIGLYKKQPACQQVLLRTIQSEITIRENQPVILPPQNGQPSEQSLQTTLSVTQLAGLVRLMVETNIFICDNQAAFLRNISKIFHIRNQKPYTSGSLRQKYYNPDAATRSILKTILTNMLVRLRTYTSSTFFMACLYSIPE